MKALTELVKFKKNRSFDCMEPLTRYAARNGGVVRKMHVSDAWTCTSAVIKKDGRFGVFELFGVNPNWPGASYMSIPDPFIFSDVMCYCNNFDIYGFVAACLNGKWGVIDIDPYYHLQLVVAYEHESFEDARSALEALLPSKLKYEWHSFKELSKQ